MKNNEIEYLTYQQLRETALKELIADNKVSVGIWAQNNGYFKTRKQINNKVTTHYFKA
jgi:hypothetical protein